MGIRRRRAQGRMQGAWFAGRIAHQPLQLGEAASGVKQTHAKLSYINRRDGLQLGGPRVFRVLFYSCHGKLHGLEAEPAEPKEPAHDLAYPFQPGRNAFAEIA